MLKILEYQAEPSQRYIHVGLCHIIIISCTYSCCLLCFKGSLSWDPSNTLGQRGQTISSLCDSDYPMIRILRREQRLEPGLAW